VAGGYVAAALALGITWLATYLLFEGALAIF
jgi:hypothetical protein